MQQIAADAGVSTATLYRRWKNKHEILLEAYLKMMGELLPSRNRLTPLKGCRSTRYGLRRPSGAKTVGYS